MECITWLPLPIILTGLFLANCRCVSGCCTSFQHFILVCIRLKKDQHISANLLNWGTQVCQLLYIFLLTTWTWHYISKLTSPSCQCLKFYSYNYCSVLFVNSPPLVEKLPGNRIKNGLQCVCVDAVHCHAIPLWSWTWRLRYVNVIFTWMNNNVLYIRIIINHAQ